MRSSESGARKEHGDGPTGPTRLMVGPCCDGQDWCSVLCTAERLSRKWHAVIVHRLLDQGPVGFSALEEAITGISGKVLAESLEALEGYGIVWRERLKDSPRRVRYHLTSAGRDLAPVVHAMREWGRRHLSAG